MLTSDLVGVEGEVKDWYATIFTIAAISCLCDCAKADGGTNAGAALQQSYQIGPTRTVGVSTPGISTD
jgi:hypothetical protein